MFTHSKKPVKRTVHYAAEIATYNMSELTIPPDAIFVDLVGFRQVKEKDCFGVNKAAGKPQVFYDDADINHEQDRILATLNTLSCFVDDLQCKSLVVILADTLAGDFQQGSKAFLNFHKCYYKTLPIAKELMYFTNWEAWRSSAAVKTISGIDAAFSTVKNYIEVFEEANIFAENRKVESLMPSFTAALEYLYYIDESGESVHHELRMLMNKVVNKTNAFEETAQYMVMGIMARRMNTPVIMMHKEPNDIIRYIEDHFIGQIRSGAPAIQTLKFKFIKRGDFVTKFFKEHPEYYEPRWAFKYENLRKKLIWQNKPGTIDISAEHLVNAVLDCLQKPATPLNAIKLLTDETDFQISLRRGNRYHDCSQQDKMMFAVSSEKPDLAELMIHLMSYLSDGDTRIEMLAEFKAKLEGLRSKPSQTRPCKFKTSYNAVYDKNKFTIPEGAILADGVCMKKSTIDPCTADPHKNNCGEYLFALLNTVDSLIESKQCAKLLVLVTDTLAATNSGARDIAPYQAAGKQYIEQNKHYYSAAALHPDQLVLTTWDNWRDNTAPAMLLGSAVNRGEYSVLTFENALANIYKMYELNSEFKLMADQVIQEFVKKEMAKLQHKTTVTQQVVEEINKQKQQYLFEETAQYWVMGDCAKASNKPIRFLHKESNALFTYVENELVGRLASGELAIQLVCISFIKKDNRAMFYSKNTSHPKLSQPDVPGQNMNVRLAKPEEILLDLMLYITKGPVPANLIAMLLDELDFILHHRKTSFGSLETIHCTAKDSYQVSDSRRPHPIETFYHLRRFLYSSVRAGTTLSAIRSTLVSISKQIAKPNQNISQTAATVTESRGQASVGI